MSSDTESKTSLSSTPTSTRTRSASPAPSTASTESQSTIRRSEYFRYRISTEIERKAPKGFKYETSTMDGDRIKHIFKSEDDQRSEVYEDGKDDLGRGHL
ncbi:hypothetical protein V865_002782 [Kwoniella europaea PYCC6329]|uniref:Uncharacterized protein n=1 Tax=Kwoniella europaea PYCC6329 TaxID=1423913 RepID=A0AAX4KEF5_9TREE